MKFAYFLHIYQPADQHPGTLEKIVNESYRPILKGLYKIPEAKITLNINATLTEKLFEHGYRDVLDDIKALVEMGRLELTGSAKYHAFLPLIPDEEVERQVKLNHETNTRYLGDAFNPKGFFSPEMGYSPKVANIVKEMGYTWILADESSVSNLANRPKNNKIYTIEGIGIEVYLREKRPSNILMGALARTADTMQKALGERMNDNEYIVMAMDGETFGHHRPGLEKALFEILESEKFENVFISELPKFFSETQEIIPMDSTWASSVQDVKSGNPFNLWFDKNNKIHEYEWALATVAIQSVNDSKFSDKAYPQMLQETRDWDDLTVDEKAGEEKKRAWVKSRDALDKALNSDPWWWASAKPWWSIEMIEKGMNALYKVTMMVPDSNSDLQAQAEDLYKKILFTAHEWQRTGQVDVMANEEREDRKIPLSKRFGASAHYKALMDVLRNQENEAVEKREYEQAIKWRDGQYKLERDLDIYDAVHIMDLFRNEGDMKKFDILLKEYREKYEKLSKGQPE